MKNKIHKQKTNKSEKQIAKAQLAIIVKWVGVALLLAVAVILAMIGYASYSGGAVLLATSVVAFNKVVSVALRCWEHRLVIAEVVLDITSLLIRIFKH